MTIVHGHVLGALYLFLFGLVFANLRSLRFDYVSDRRNLSWRVIVGTGAIAALGWATALSGTLFVYPAYRTTTKAVLLASSRTAGWHTIGMEWKEHVGWIAPILATAAAFIAAYYGSELSMRPWTRKLTWMLLIGAFASSVLAGLLGIFIGRAAWDR